MENSYKYFKRDISWLSFNYRVLLEAEDETLPVYERIKFLSIYSSNLEEFYEIRVAEHRGVIIKKQYADEGDTEAEQTLEEITQEVNRQQREYYRIFSDLVLPELNKENIYLYQNCVPEPYHEDFVHNFFNLTRIIIDFRHNFRFSKIIGRPFVSFIRLEFFVISAQNLWSANNHARS